MTALDGAINVGPVLARELRAAGIDDIEQLRALGAREAWDRVRQVNPERDCASSLLALEGAIRGVRWTTIDAGERERIGSYARERKRR